MTERCAGPGQSRINGWADREERSCEVSNEDPEAARIRLDRQAEARQNEWISCGDHDAGMSRSAMSTRGSAPNASIPTDADKRRAANARKAEETRKLDRPIESDLIGNAIPGLIAGGIFAGVEAAAAEAGAAGIAGSIAKHSAEHIAGDVIEHGAHAGAHALAEDEKKNAAAGHAPKAAAEAATPGSESESETAKPYGPAPPPMPPPNGGASGAAGRSSEKATSETAPEPNKSEGPALRGRDRVPYRPGEAPLRVPEAPHASLTSAPFVLRG